ncbi:helix-hairpin-helix domain-containing protein [Ideonella sp. B508-1]|uniref:ComEA family DNA-binding protein n=1 Tax=Ideonella sp. B508-1 TaxID=137716 RepID=UPI00034D1B97|nr:helix-hairpin-helix domain-containing protein [Ideonella sp. B508-1]
MNIHQDDRHTPGRTPPGPHRRRLLIGIGLLLAGPLALAAAAEAPLDTEVNEANQAELEMIKGIGPQLSTQILGERVHGPFRDWSDFIARLPGVGPGKARKLSAAGLRVGGQPFSAP